MWDVVPTPHIENSPKTSRFCFFPTLCQGFRRASGGIVPFRFGVVIMG